LAGVLRHQSHHFRDLRRGRLPGAGGAPVHAAGRPGSAMRHATGPVAGFRRVLVAVLALALGGCAGGATGPAGGAAPELVGTYWGLLEVDGNSFPDYQGTREPYIAFRREGSVAGFAGCNTMGGGYEVSGERLRVGPLAMTRMACAGSDGMVMESAF